MPSYSLHKTLCPPSSGQAGALLCLIFFNEGSMLASGGDDLNVRIWDVRTGNLQQVMHDHRWGQITNLSILDDPEGQSPKFNTQLGTLMDVFRLNQAVQVQALDPVNSLFAVGSFQGEIKMYRIDNRKTLVHIWTVSSVDIPCSILFLGHTNEMLVVHTMVDGEILTYNPRTSELIETVKLRAGVGSVALSPNRRVKAIFNTETWQFDIFEPTESLTPWPVRISSSTRRLKRAVFAEDGHVLVCGGDDGLLHVSDIVAGTVLPLLLHSRCSTIYAMATCSTDDYHLIASGGSDDRAEICIWTKPTVRKEEADRWRAANQAAHQAEAARIAQEQAEADETARALEEERDAHAAEIDRLKNELEEHYRLYWGGLMVVILLLLYMFCGNVLGMAPFYPGDRSHIHCSSDFSRRFLKNLLRGAPFRRNP
ncbi:WD40-repeat-containing domain protein [Mycena sp. CBHHK59/15]|nr:WD40-repeat-containing domain protein [Mycena sp. CBHHK59/15]